MWQHAQCENWKTVKLRQLNGIQPSLIFILWHVKIASMKKVLWLWCFDAIVWLLLIILPNIVILLLAFYFFSLGLNVTMKWNCLDAWFIAVILKKCFKCCFGYRPHIYLNFVSRKWYTYLPHSPQRDMAGEISTKPSNTIKLHSSTWVACFSIN